MGPFTAFEIDPLAARCCRENFQRHQVPGLVHNHDITQPPCRP